MKTLLVLVISLFYVYQVFGQSDNSGSSALESFYKKEKKEIVKASLNIPEESENTFWELYNQYQAKLNELNKKRTEIIKSYSDRYYVLEEEEIRDMLKSSMQLNMDYGKLINTYSKKIAQSVNITSAAQFYQLENYILSLVRVEIMKQVPMIGEFDKKLN